MLCGPVAIYSMRKILSILGFTILLANAYGQILVSAELDSSFILIGDQVDLHILINHQSNVEVREVDVTPLGKAEGIEVMDYGKLDTIKSGDEFILEQVLTVTAFDSGYYFIPEIPIKYVRDGQTGIEETKRLALKVNTLSVGTDSVRIEPIKEIIKEPVSVKDFLPYIGALMVIIGLLGLWFYSRKRKGKAKAPPEVKLPAHVIALNKLEELRQAKLWQQGKVKEYQSELTFIVREYLENRFGIRALESTSSEIINQMRLEFVDPDWINRLANIFRTADLVKFAKAEPPASIHDEAMEQVRSFLEETQLVIIEVEKDQDEFTK